MLEQTAAALRKFHAGGKKTTHASSALPKAERSCIVMPMATQAVSRVEPSVFFGGISRRILRLIKAQAEDWHDECRHLSDWEDQHLLEQPDPELLDEHSQRLDELERVGHWISLVTQSPDFPDPATADLVAMTLKDLKDARALWHGNLTRERRQEILRAVFNEP